MDLKDSKTRINLMRAFAGEGQARNRYDIAASIAKGEKLKIIQDLFQYTADQEKAHAKIFYNLMKEFTGSHIIIENAGYPVDNYSSTLQQLKAAAHNEHEEWSDVYHNFSKVAREEGFEKIANAFYNVASIEKVHGERFARYAREIEEGTLFKKSEEHIWICTHCGFIYEGKEAPQNCPACHHPQDFYILFSDSMFQ